MIITIIMTIILVFLIVILLFQYFVCSWYNFWYVITDIAAVDVFFYVIVFLIIITDLDINVIIENLSLT